MKYTHVISAVMSKPWMIRPETLAVIVDMLHFRSEGGRLTEDQIQQRIEAAGGPRNRQQAQAGPGIAHLQLFGVIAPRFQMLEDTSTAGTGLDRFMGAFRAAMNDPEIGSIVMEIDSPGGLVDGVPEAAAEIRAAREQKPVIAVANYMAASAAYYIGSQASEFIASPSAEVGSIGVRTAHEDHSGALEQKGIKITSISAGKYKTEGAPWAPLGDEARDYVQAQIDDLYGMFLADVAKGRNVPVSMVTENFGEGRMLLAKAAMKAGMIDRIDTFDGVVRRELARPAKSRQVAALGPGWDVVLEAAPAEPEATEPKPDVSFEVEMRRRRTAVR